MCLAVPGKVLDCDETSGVREGRVQFAGIVRRVRLDFVPEAEVGDYVMVHVGFAISRIDAEEAERTLALLAEMGALAGTAPEDEAPEDEEDAAEPATEEPARTDGSIADQGDERNRPVSGVPKITA
jgi:hydrogenase expression/formation protein HypC